MRFRHGQSLLFEWKVGLLGRVKLYSSCTRRGRGNAASWPKGIHGWICRFRIRKRIMNWPLYSHETPRISHRQQQSTSDDVVEADEDGAPTTGGYDNTNGAFSSPRGNRTPPTHSLLRLDTAPNEPWSDPSHEPSAPRKLSSIDRERLDGTISLHKPPGVAARRICITGQSPLLSVDEDAADDTLPESPNGGQDGPSLAPVMHAGRPLRMLCDSARRGGNRCMTRKNHRDDDAVGSISPSLLFDLGSLSISATTTVKKRLKFEDDDPIHPSILSAQERALRIAQGLSPPPRVLDESPPSPTALTVEGAHSDHHSPLIDFEANNVDESKPSSTRSDSTETVAFPIHRICGAVRGQRLFREDGVPLRTRPREGGSEGESPIPKKEKRRRRY